MVRGLKLTAVLTVLCLMSLLISSCVIVVDDVKYLVTVDNTNFAFTAVYVWVDGEYSGFHVYGSETGERELKIGSKITLSKYDDYNSKELFNDGTGYTRSHILSDHVTLIHVPE